MYVFLEQKIVLLKLRPTIIATQNLNHFTALSLSLLLLYYISFQKMQCKTKQQSSKIKNANFDELQIKSKIAFLGWRGLEWGGVGWGGMRCGGGGRN